jgi:hypothetical protein
MRCRVSAAMIGPLPDAAAGHLANCPLDEVVAHELGHWIVTQHCGDYPDMLAVYGIVYTHNRATVTKGATVPFWTSLQPTREEVTIYVAGHVAERLYRERSVEPATLIDSLRRDETCAHDLACATSIAERMPNDVDGTLKESLHAAFDILRSRLDAISSETQRIVSNATMSGLESFEIDWSPELAAKLCGGSSDWYG